MPFVERDCTIEHEGRTFEAGGAVVADGYVIAYPGESGILKDWHGNAIGAWRATSSWVQPGAWGCPRMYQIEARIDGVVYTGRGMGEGMIYRGRRKRGAVV